MVVVHLQIGTLFREDAPILSGITAMQVRITSSFIAKVEGCGAARRTGDWLFGTAAVSDPISASLPCLDGGDAVAEALRFAAIGAVSRCRCSAGTPRAQRFPAPQPPHLGPCARRGSSSKRRNARLADHRTHGERTGPRGVRGPRLAARSALRGHQQPHQARRGHAGDRSSRRDYGAATRSWAACTKRRPGPRGRSVAEEPDADARSRIIALLSSAPVGLDDLTRISAPRPASCARY